MSPEADRKTEIPNWKDVLNEQRVIRCGYIIPNNNIVVGNWVYIAVYKTLTGKDIIKEQQQPLLEEMWDYNPALSAGVEWTLGNLENSRLMSGYKDELAEAEAQGSIAAKADLNQYQPFRIHYDYWQGMIRIGESVSVSRIDGDSNNLLLEAPVDRIGGKIGFPQNLLLRRIEIRSSKQIDVNTEIANRFMLLGYDPEQIYMNARNSEVERHFDNLLGDKRYDILKEMGYAFTEPFDIDIWSQYYSNRNALLKEVYSKLEQKDKDCLKAPQPYYLVATAYSNLSSNDQTARLQITSGLGTHNLSYDPDTGNMVGDFSSIKEGSFEIRVDPVITAKTTHLDLLEIRSQSVKLAKQAKL